MDNQIKSKEQNRKGIALASILIGALSIIASILTIIGGIAIIETLWGIVYVVLGAITAVLAIVYIVLGALFYKKDSKAIAITLIVLFGYYVIDKLFALFMGSYISALWLIFGIYMIYVLTLYLKQPAEKPSDVIDIKSNPNEKK